jgi:uncharacterized surface protein with fasciclin (FAS1) repeats
MVIFLTAPVPAALTAHTGRMKNLIDAAADAGNLKKLLSAFNSASLIDMLRSPGKHTFHAHTDARGFARCAVQEHAHAQAGSLQSHDGGRRSGQHVIRRRLRQSWAERSR